MYPRLHHHLSSPSSYAHHAPPEVTELVKRKTRMESANHLGVAGWDRLKVIPLDYRTFACHQAKKTERSMMSNGNIWYQQIFIFQTGATNEDPLVMITLSADIFQTQTTMRKKPNPTRNYVYTASQSICTNPPPCHMYASSPSNKDL